jgi:hypothetical protein
MPALLSKGFHVLSRLRPRFTYANVAATLALILAMGGGAYAAINSIPGPGGVIHGCYSKHGGSLRLVGAGSNCGASEKAIAFNQKGPIGPSDAYQASTNTPADPLTLTLAVPAGSYAVVAKALGSSDPTTTSAPGGAECVLSSSGAADDDFSVNDIPMNAVSSFANTLAYTSRTPSTIQYKCDGSGGTPPTRGFYQTRIVATKVGTVH